MGVLKKIRIIIRLVCYKSIMFWHGLFGLPVQTSKEIRLLKVIFNEFKDKKINIFEWGSGLSTIYYSKYLKKKGFDFKWHAIENNKGWYNKVLSMVKTNGLGSFVQVHLKEFLPFWQKPGWAVIPPPCGMFGPKTDNEKAYIDLPKTLNAKFNIVIVDARFRRHCLKVAKDVLAAGGIVVLHDAQKEHYHEGVDNFKYNKFILSNDWIPFQDKPTKIWLGSVDNESLFSKVISCVN